MLPSNPPRLATNYLPYALLIVAALLAYCNIYNNAFLFDDEFLFQKNEWLHSWQHIGDVFISNSTAGFGGHDSFYRPLQLFSYVVLTQLFGYHEPVYHAFNLFLHIVNACLVFRLAGKLGFARVPALIAALIWTLHPIHTEAITYMSATADPMHALFVLLGVLIWDEKKWRKQAAACGFFALALMSKETALILPALVIVMLFFKHGFAKPKVFLQTWPLWLMAALYLVLRATALNFNEDFKLYKYSNVYTEHLYVRVLTFFAVLPDYFRLLLAPSDLHMEYFPVAFVDFSSPKVQGGIAIILAAIGILYAGFRKPDTRLRPLAFGVLWFFAAYFPCTGIVIPVNAFFLEHWMYVPSIGLFLGAAETLRLYMGGNKTVEAVGIAISGVVIVLFAVLTWQQNETWHDPIVFYNRILSFEKGTARVHNNLGMAYEDAGQRELAILHYEKAIATDDTYPQTRYNHGVLMFKTGNAQRGIDDMKRALELNPDFYRASDVLAQVYRQLGDTKKADEYLRQSKRR
jgi:tetratricopeptide (TPR) repeat protein